MKKKRALSRPKTKAQGRTRLKTKAKQKAVPRRRPKTRRVLIPKQRFVAAPSPALIERRTSQHEESPLPSGYGDHKLVLLVRDPWWLYAYWELHSEACRRLYEEATRRSDHARMVLRVYDVTDLDHPKNHSYFDIELNFHTDNWYIDVGKPSREWIAEIGYRNGRGEFFCLVRSNRVRTPSFGLSDVLDEEWMLPEGDFFKILGRMGGPGAGGSEDIRLLLERYLKRSLSSEIVQKREKSKV